MDDVSVSKGVFAFKGSYKIGRKKIRPSKPAFMNEPWYVAYKEIWSTIENAEEKINSKMFKQILTDLKIYVSTIDYDSLFAEIPTAILLTGVNLPDHGALFQMLSNEFKDVTSYISIVQRRDSYNLKNMMEETVYQLINSSKKNKFEIKKNQCTPSVLNSWYQEREIKTPLVIIIPDFESFSPDILQDFILILSVYSKTIKFVLIFGIATALYAVHRSLPHNVTSKLQVQVFHAETQVKSLSGVLEGTVLSVDTPFKLTGRAFQLLTDIFLFYDFSVNGFLQGYKLCTMQHFYGNNMNALCCDKKNVASRISELTGQDLEEIKKLNSVANYIQELSKDQRESTSKDDEFKDLLLTLINQIHTFTCTFQIILKCLHHLTSDLPNAPLGKQLREVYAKAVNCAITESQEYKECLQFLNFLSKEEFLLKVDSMSVIIEASDGDQFEDVKVNLRKHTDAVRDASLEITREPMEVVDANEKLSRIQLKEKLLKMSQKHSVSPYKRAQTELLNYLDKQIFAVYLRNPMLLPASEIFFFNDGNSMKRHIVGSPRAAIHTGLNNPHAYLECSCCTSDNEQSIIPTLPDLSIIYKLHLECRRLINMYDWLQAFLSIVSPDTTGEEQREVDDELQARFTRAVAELQFLGFIKTSRKKTDHVTRLTWGCS